MGTKWWPGRNGRGGEAKKKVGVKEWWTGGREGRKDVTAMVLWALGSEGPGNVFPGGCPGFQRPEYINQSIYGKRSVPQTLEYAY